MDKELNKYLRKIRSMIPGSLCDRRRIMDSIENSIENYREQNPDASAAQIKAHFGSPEHIVADYLEEQSSERLLRTLRIKKRILAIVAGTMAAILLSYCARMTIEIATSHRIRNGYIVTAIDGRPIPTVDGATIVNLD